MSTESVQVAVRVRPFNSREKDRNATCIIRMRGKTTVIINPDTEEEKEFAFDYSYWSHDGFDVLDEPAGYNEISTTNPSKFGAEYASQKTVYDGLGAGVLTNALKGFNCCLFAYGQTGAGKSYSFVGYGNNRGIVPQVCDEVFRRKIEIEQSGTTKLQVTFSMMEIYNEKIRDLLNPNHKTNNDLKVRSTAKGTFVEGTKPKVVNSFKEIDHTMEQGTASRTVAATQMNATSSRAHTIMTIKVAQMITDEGRTKEICSDMNLIDLAGSERAESTGATGDRLKEGAAINKSLSALGNVISALAEQANNPKKKIFVPYRDSKLTQILQTALGGNSKTIMVAALSPADINFEETLGTLRYADRAKQIKVIVEIQENPTDKLIRQLKEENDKLKKMLEGMDGGMDIGALMGGAGGGEGTITEEQMQQAIADAVAQVKEASAAEKKAAVEAAKQEMMARHEGLMRGMMARSDMEATLRDAVMAMGGSEKDKKAALEKALAALDSKYTRRKAGGMLDYDDILFVVDEAIANSHPSTTDDSEQAKALANALAKAKANAREVFKEDKPMWKDGVINLSQFMDAMGGVVASVPDHKDKILENARHIFQRETEAAMGDMLSKDAMKGVILKSIAGLQGDSAKVVNAAEMRFDQLQRDAEEGVVDESAMQLTMERALAKIGGASQEERKMAMQFARKTAGWKSGAMDSAAMQAARAKMQIAQTLMKNQEMMSNLTMSWDEKQEISAKESEENQKLLTRLGLAGISEEDMKVTPSLRNLNQDPLMSDSLVYYLQAGETIVTTPNADIAEGVVCIELGGGGMMPNHAVIEYDPSANSRKVVLRPGSGVSFVNGQQCTSEVTLAHNDRVILGNSQAFRFVDPVTAAKEEGAGKPKQIIDWDLAQHEINEAMGMAVTLKVDEEIAKKKAELDAQLKAMEEKFARENDALRKQLDGKSDTAKMRAMDQRAAAIEAFKMRAKAHVSEYKRDLIRLEEQLSKVVPRVKEANTMALQLGRCVKFEARLVNSVPESSIEEVLSPVEELYTQKTVELLILAALHNPRSDMKRTWFMTPEAFFDRISGMRDMWQKWMLEQVMGQLHVKSDPFWSKPESDLVGKCYLYLAPLCYQVEISQWLPIIDVFGVKQGELRVQLTPYEADYRTKLKPTADGEAILHKKLHFVLRIEQARGLMETANKNVYIEYLFSDQEGSHKTGVAQGKKFDPKFGEEHKFEFLVSDTMMRYLQKDAICFQVYGEADDVDEDDIAEATQMELPPETFEFFMSVDFHDASSGKGMPFVPDMTPDEPGYVLHQSSAHKLILAIAQSDKNFKIVKLVRGMIGNFRDKNTEKSFDASWVPCMISKQGRLDEHQPWIAELEVNSLPAKMNSPEALGTIFSVDLKCEVDEVERLALEEPLQLLKTITIQVQAKGTAKLVDVNTAEQQKRFKRTAKLQEIYMGQWEVSNEAVNIAMTELRNQDDAGADDIMKRLEADVARLQTIMFAEQRRQAEDLSTRLLAHGIDAGALIQMSVVVPDDIGHQSGDDKSAALLAQKAKAEEDAARAIKDKLALEQEVAALKARIKQLESNQTAGSAAAVRIGQLQKQLKSAKMVNGNGVAVAPDGSKACVIS
eukprot:CAMPEP_0182806980 /NCGR_PEP_ID=MMETSP0006_2-20121128/5888_1 /TAXON_ID=97485 /ORGANISM="Prymnesium parvum, Strain Texoma1" /LENGTH=1608 /DNA_ID=CAMNT_0024932631 /DNA_START=18 /DNA_END=4844 /DNA_ORIENTATION=-